MYIVIAGLYSSGTMAMFDYFRIIESLISHWWLSGWTYHLILRLFERVSLSFSWHWMGPCKRVGRTVYSDDMPEQILRDGYFLARPLSRSFLVNRRGIDE